MTTSSSDTSRCTRISPSAVLDDRLDGKDLEWARDHLRRCEACRERVEDFREMLLRVGRLPKATIAAGAMDQAFTAAVPQRLRDEAITRSFELAPPDTSRILPPLPELPPPMQPEVTGESDLMTELEREIFRDEPVQDHPTPLPTASEPLLPAMASNEPAAEEVASQEADLPTISQPEADDLELAAAPIASPGWREVPIDSHREPEVAAEEPAPAAAATAEEHRNVIYEAEPALMFDQTEAPAATPKKKSDNGMRIAVGLGAAGCVLLAALLYEGGSVFKAWHLFGAAVPTVSATPIRASATVRPSASATPAPRPSKPPATLLYTLGNGISGGSVYRIRPGTAVAGYTRLVFDIRGSGLPSMIITRPDDMHIDVIFKETNVNGVPVSGIRSYHVSAVEPAVQQGRDGTFTVDLARPVRVTAFTLPATGGYAWRLVVDLHTS